MLQSEKSFVAPVKYAKSDRHQPCGVAHITERKIKTAGINVTSMCKKKKKKK